MAVIVLTVSWRTVTPLLAITTAAAALLAGVVPFALVYGTKPHRRRRVATSWPGLGRRRRFPMERTARAAGRTPDHRAQNMGAALPRKAQEKCSKR
ncbi:hypothetical protein [Actinomadura livida]|uniref:hypothetical protein n=1 Tax=Actinomadura livida TaxID=79909 RepID=UPI00167034EF|nr:hypothetical protein [Actinomadura livida]